MQITKAMMRWLANGERGISSQAIFETVTGVPCRTDWRFDTYPRDPDDVRRCELLLDACPELRAKLDMMRTVSPEWNALVEAWPQIIAACDHEARGWWTSKAYKLMKHVTFCAAGSGHCCGESPDA